MNKPFILIADNDPAMRSLIGITMETQNYKYHTAETGTKALLEVVSQKPDVILLETVLPDVEGITIIRKIRSWSSMPIIVVSERNKDRDIVDALDAGADDYITKPFSPNELLARLRVVLRRLTYMQTSDGMNSSEFINGELLIDLAAGCVCINDNELHLTPIEYRLLCLLAKNVGKVLTHTYITKEIWGSAWDNDIASLRVFMTTLRKKIETNSKYKYIQTHVGIGYRMVQASKI